MRYRNRDRPPALLGVGAVLLLTVALLAVLGRVRILRAALDLGRQQALLTLLLKLRQRGVAIIITTHLPNHALILGGQTGLFFPDGHFTVGASKQVMTGANLSTLYQTNLKVFFAAALGRWICEPTS